MIFQANSVERNIVLRILGLYAEPYIRSPLILLSLARTRIKQYFVYRIFFMTEMNEHPQNSGRFPPVALVGAQLLMHGFSLLLHHDSHKKVLSQSLRCYKLQD